MGRNPKPTEQHKRDGTYNSTRHGNRADNVIEFAGLPEPMIPLKGDALKLWKHLLETLPDKVIKKADSVLMSTLCETWARYRLLVSQWEKCREDKDAFRMMKQTQSEFTLLAVQFGLSPIARAKLTAQTGGQDKVDPIASMLKAHFASN